MQRVFVIGGGAAGCMAAWAASRRGAVVELFEKNDIVGKKMGITGKGRCNLTNSCPMDAFIAKTPGNGRFLHSAYEQFTNRDLCSLLRQWGMATKEERGGRIFPQSDSAVAVRKLWYHKLLQAGVTIHLQEEVQHIAYRDSFFVITTANGVYEGDACVIATGGVSYPTTGSTGDGHRFAAALGHTVTPLKPSLIALVTQEEWPKQLAGLTLKNVEASIWKNGKPTARQFGEMVCTHTGISGPIILQLSSVMAHHKKMAFPIDIRLNLKPALRPEQLEQRIWRELQAHIRQDAKNALKTVLPQRLLAVVLAAAHISQETVAHQITKEQRRRLVTALQALPLTAVCTRPIEEAIVTAGGVEVKEMNPKTMESKYVPGLYFAGEVLDVDAFTGGYNLQAAFSTGYVAGSAAAQEDEA
ncbi:NAD(P)/FAD-dependent oxidoreductase [uncultured Megasphaera sp.]|jgi:hypothetical protein|uniref:NAD(P)/FAD-dependent oxidoreductase n=1 Tax=uncultured Megasphaera sp. TaxID=165188 RepID=UPI000782DE66|nr:NAD(P)/FAD-dependent oxidoreductase [uncultured Megasphaera sp.]KXB89423.1 flavoprotein family protein [Veillonellaceae bacterium DNF00751]MUP50079.1 NAD(P)/FAD-dependent oxidoreductase [Veillonellaceae bacterium M1-70]